VSDSQSMGDYLRAARRRRRVSIERAAEDTKIQAKFLMQMESDVFDFLAAAYVRGFLRTYARYLRVDPEPLIKEFDRRFGYRVDTAQIIAAQRRARSGRKRAYSERRTSGWAIAAFLAALFLAVLAVIGLQNPPENEPASDDGRVANRPESPTPTATPTVRSSPTPTPTPTDGVIAFDDGIEVQIAATYARCWINVTSDDDQVFSDTLEVGESETFAAEEEMVIVFGFPEGVDLTVNGTKLGRPGGEAAITITLPDDIESLT
jgi:cytoskeleton protein RodZ